MLAPSIHQDSTVSITDTFTSERIEHYMRAAIREARHAESLGEVPVGAIVVRHGVIIGAAGNRRETRRDPTAHAEILALQEAARRTGTWHLDGAYLFVTLEPCPMCAGALVNARIIGLIYGAEDPKAGACDSLYDIPRDARLNHNLPVLGGVLAAECGELLTAFFQRLRKR
jgi:tRNA(adenine34) deaminase